MIAILNPKILSHRKVANGFVPDLNHGFGLLLH